jgi:N-acetylglucosaminyldiphosphoundecaprenol N-acetyl-beta-D-mannosaminyltransferase
MLNHNRFSILGIKFSIINTSQAIDIIQNWINHRSKFYVCVTPAHGVMECKYHPELIDIFNGSGMTTPDGMSIVWLLKLYGHKRVERVYGPDLMRSVCEFSAKNGNYRHFLYGGAPGIAEELSHQLRKLYPGIKIVGTISPPFRELTVDEDIEFIEKINQSKADIVWVGISSPKQEKWMASHIDSLNASVLIGVGAAFDFIAGNKKEAPKWIQRIGMQWLFRFVMEPKRLFHRYINYPYFVWLVLLEFIRRKWRKFETSS